jgi:hypothetical protein
MWHAWRIMALEPTKDSRHFYIGGGEYNSNQSPKSVIAMHQQFDEDE